MATRIVLFDAEGVALVGLDGHHGAGQAARWIAASSAQLDSRGVRWFAVEITPARGGDDVRRGVIGRLHTLRAQLHETPTGSLELVGVTSERQAVHGGLRVVAAHPSLKLPIQSLRMPRGRQSAGPADSPDALRLARRLSRSQRRSA